MPDALQLSNLNNSQTSLGIGLASPLTFDSTVGDLAVVQEEEAVKQCIRDLIETDIGEVPGMEEAGTSLSDLISEPANLGAQDVVIIEIKRAIALYEKRVHSVNVKVESEKKNGAVTLRITLSWRFRRHPGNLGSMTYSMDATGGQPSGWH